MYVHPFNEGQDARESGKSEHDCPYLGDDWRRAAWLHGWEYADERLPPIDDALDFESLGRPLPSNLVEYLAKE
jgi:ribosome modulation factor